MLPVSIDELDRVFGPTSKAPISISFNHRFSQTHYTSQNNTLSNLYSRSKYLGVMDCAYKLPHAQIEHTRPSETLDAWYR